MEITLFYNGRVKNFTLFLEKVMNNALIISRHHPVLTRAAELNQICAPLRDYFDIDYFTFARVYNDGFIAVLNNTPNISEIFYRNLYRHRLLFDTSLVNITKSYKFLTWSLLTENKLLRIFKNDFNLKDGILLFENGKDFTDYYNFGTTKDSSMIDFLMSHLEVLNNFILYFKENAKPLVFKAIENKFKLPSSPDLSSYLDKDFYDPQVLIRQFNNAIKTKKFYVSPLDNDVQPLSKKEFETFGYYTKGYSIKEIALFMEISTRTVETNLSKIRRKLKCYTNKELRNCVKLVSTFDLDFLKRS